MDPRAAEAFVHAAPPWFARWRGQSAYVVGGRRLYPFNLWHLHVLDARGNPYAQIGPAAASHADFLMAVEICAQPAMTPPPVSRGGWRARYRRWKYGRRHARELAAWLRAGQPAAAFISTDLANFLIYLRDYAAFPDFWRRDNSKPVGSPVALFRMQLLQHLFGWGDYRCWATPAGEAVWVASARLEAMGHDPKIMTEEERTACLKLGWKL